MAERHRLVLDIVITPSDPDPVEISSAYSVNEESWGSETARLFRDLLLIAGVFMLGVRCGARASNG